MPKKTCNYLLNVIRNLSFVSGCCGEKFCCINCVVATLQAVVVTSGGGWVVVWRGGGGVGVCVVSVEMVQG